MKKKVVGFAMLILVVVVLLFMLRVPIFKGFANFLIVESEFEKVEIAFVLSGGAFDRGNKAAELYSSEKVESFVCTGANQSPDIKALGVDILESELTKLQMLKMGVPDSLVILLKEGTSTLEESELILSYCLSHELEEIVVVSSKFHTRRIHQVFTKKFKEDGIAVYIQGASSSSYNELEWWKSENGLIALNNEYLKQLYYLINY